MHQVNEPAWRAFVARHGIGDVVDGHVVSVVPFGAFIRVGDGVDGLAPQSLWPRLPAAGSTIPVRITMIDADNRRMAFGPA
jgi:ribosomal protein S1